MSYRHPFTDESEVCAVPTKTRLHILNGTTTEILVTCRYRIPAIAPATDDTYEDIDLAAEGYGQPVVAFYPNVSGLTGEAAIDVVNTNVVHVFITANCPTAEAEDVEVDFSVLATRTPLGSPAITDAIIRGILEIEDSPLPAVS